MRRIMLYKVRWQDCNTKKILQEKLMSKATYYRYRKTYPNVSESTLTLFGKDEIIHIINIIV